MAKLKYKQKSYDGILFNGTNKAEVLAEIGTRTLPGSFAGESEALITNMAPGSVVFIISAKDINVFPPDVFAMFYEEDKTKP